MAQNNRREIELALSITTANADALTNLQKDVRDLAKEGGNAAPAFQQLADELGQLAEQAKQLTALEGLTQELEATATAQKDAAQTSGALKQSLSELVAATDAARAAESAKNQELSKAKLAAQEAQDAIARLKNDTDAAGKTSAEYTTELRKLTTAVLDAKAGKRELAAELEQLKLNTKEAAEATKAQGQAYRDADKDARAVTAALGTLQTQVDGVTAKYIEAGGAAGELATAQRALEASAAGVRQSIQAVITDQERLAQAERETAREIRQQSAIIEETKQRLAAQAKAEADGIIADYQRMEQAQRDAAQSARTAGEAIAGAFGVVGQRSVQEIRQEIERVREAMRLLATSGAATGSELATAMRTGEAAIKGLQREIREVTGTLTTADKAAALFRNSIGQITAGNLIADGVGFLVEKVKALGAAFISTTVTTETLRRSLAAIYKDTATAGAQFDFLRDTANKTGVSVDGIRDAFVRFSASAKSANIPLQVSNDLFAAVTRTASSLGLSADATGGALDALGQIASKGTVSLEELRQQLGDRMPGALGAAAKGLGLTEAELIKLVESGKLAARDFFPAFTKGLTEMQGSMEGLLPSFNRLKNALVLLAQNASDSVFGAVFAASLKLATSAVGILGGALSAFIEILGLAGKAVALLLPGVGSLSDRMKIFGEEVDAAASRQSKFSAAIDGALDPVTQAAAVTANLATATQAAAAAASAAGDKWDSLSRSQQATAIAAQIAAQRQGDAAAIIAGTVAVLEQLLSVQEKETTAREKSAKAAATEGGTLVELARLRGNEVELLNAVVAAKELEATALEKVAFSRAEEVRLLELQREAIVKQRTEQGVAVAEIEKEVAALDKKITVSKADVEQSRAAADAAKGLVDSSRLQRAAYDDNSKSVAEYKTRMAELTVALAEYGRLNIEGKKSDADVAAVRKELAEVTSKYRDSLNDAAVAASGEADAKTQALQITRMALGSEVELLEAKARLARASGDSKAAIDLERQAREAKLKIDQLALEIKEIELKLAAQELTLKQQLLAIDEPGNALKAKSLELQQKMVAAQLEGLKASRELLGLRKEENTKITEAAQGYGNLTGKYREATSAARVHASAVADIAAAYTDAGAKAAAAAGQFLDAAQKQRNADTAASSIKNRPESASQGVWTKSMIVDYLKQSGLSEQLSEELSKEFTRPDGSVPYSASSGQLKYGGKFSTLSEALGKASEYYRFTDKGKSEAANTQEYLDKNAASKAPIANTAGARSAPTPTPGTSTGTPVYITIDGTQRQINTDAAGAATLQQVLGRLGAASTRAS